MSGGRAQARPPLAFLAQPLLDGTWEPYHLPASLFPGQPMSESISSTQPLKEPSFWEDLIDIYFQPVAVFRRGERRSVWPPMLFVALSIGLIFFATFNTLLYQVLGRFDLIALWVTVLLAIGVYVTGNISKTRAVVFGVLIWVIGSLPMLQAGYMAM